jgi:hypothetical protein
MLAKNWRLCMQLAAGAIKICCRVSNGVLSFASVWRHLRKVVCKPHHLYVVVMGRGGGGYACYRNGSHNYCISKYVIVLVCAVHVKVVSKLSL